MQDNYERDYACQTVTCADYDASHILNCRGTNMLKCAEYTYEAMPRKRKEKEE